MAEILRAPRGMTRAQRCRFEQLTVDVGRITDGDARYFERFPARRHRVRYASRVELEQNAMLLGVDKIETEPGRRWFTCVKSLALGVRTRLFVQNAADADPDMDEQNARGVYEWLAKTGSSKALEIEAKVRALVEKRRVGQ